MTLREAGLPACARIVPMMNTCHSATANWMIAQLADHIRRSFAGVGPVSSLGLPSRVCGSAVRGATNRLSVSGAVRTTVRAQSAPAAAAARWRGSEDLAGAATGPCRAPVRRGGGRAAPALSPAPASARGCLLGYRRPAGAAPQTRLRRAPGVWKKGRKQRTGAASVNACGSGHSWSTSRCLS